MVRTVSISLPIYIWDSKDAYQSFSIFWHTLENWLLLSHIMPDSEDPLQYVFAALGTKSMEMHAQWMLTSSEEKQRATKAKASAFLDRIHQGMTHDVNTHVYLGELNDVVARPGEDPQDLIASIKTLMDCCKMINDEHHKHKPCCSIIRAYHHEGKLLGKLVAKPFTMPENKSPTAPNVWTQSTTTGIKWPTPAMIAMVTHQLHPPKTAPIAHNSNQPAEQTALHRIPGAPNATRLDTGDQNAVVASHFNQRMHLCQGMHPQLGHSMGGPDAHLGVTTATLGRVAKQMP